MASVSARIERALVEARGQGLALDVLHRDVDEAVGLADFVHGANVRMVERGRGPGLAFEALARLRVGLVVRPQQLEGDTPAELCVLGQVDVGHAAGAQLRAESRSARDACPRSVVPSSPGYLLPTSHFDTNPFVPECFHECVALVCVCDTERNCV